MKKYFCILALFIFIFSNRVWAEEVDYFDVKIGNSYSEGQELNITSNSNIYLVNADLDKFADLNSKKVTVKLDSGKILLYSDDKVFSNDFSKNGDVYLGTDNYLKLKNEYRGYIHFKIKDNKLIVINHIDLESYLKGVVPKELSAEYPMESLKAQAICSRGFAIKNKNKYSKYGYNLDDTTNCQVYRGKSAEKERSNKAVDETFGIYLTFDNKVADTIFGASSGGYIADAKEVWGGESVPYLLSKEDPYSEKYTWEYKLSKDKIREILNNNKIDIGEFIAFSPIDFDSSNRIKNIEIIGTNSSLSVKSNKFRNLFGNVKIKSTLFSISDNGDEVIFNGKGYGHGVGMSQYGAVEMAKEGKNYKEILYYYFPGTLLNNEK